MDNLEIISAIKTLIKQNINLFTTRDFTRIFKVKPKTARAFLSYHTKKGTFIRLKKGLYFVASNPPSKFEIANYLKKPSYISLETALSYHHIIPETIYPITCVTTRAPASFTIQNQVYHYHRLQEGLFFGYQPVKIQGQIILMATKEKALLDYLYFTTRNNQPINDRLDLNNLDRTILPEKLAVFKNNLRKSKALEKAIQKLKI